MLEELQLGVPPKGFVFEIIVVMYCFSLVHYKTSIKIQILYLETMLWYPNGLALKGLLKWMHGRNLHSMPEFSLH